MESLDPRVQRFDINPERTETQPNEHWPTWEVFHQKKRGAQAIHVGIVHAPSPELALIFGKEQFGRRQHSFNIWVVQSSNVYTFRNEDENMFKTIPEKTYREATGYRVRDKINAFKAESEEA